MEAAAIVQGGLPSSLTLTLTPTLTRAPFPLESPRSTPEPLPLEEIRNSAAEALAACLRLVYAQQRERALEACQVLFAEAAMSEGGEAGDHGSMLAVDALVACCEGFVESVWPQASQYTLQVSPLGP